NPTKVEDALIRFIDVGVEPGKTYAYLFQVRMANPNFGNKEVSSMGLARDKELLSPRCQTQPVTIPGDYYYYAVDQKPDPSVKIVSGSDTKNASSDPTVPYGKWTTAIQIHRWIPKFTDGPELAIADWAIAER